MKFYKLMLVAMRNTRAIQTSTQKTKWKNEYNLMKWVFLYRTIQIKRNNKIRKELKFMV